MQRSLEVIRQGGLLIMPTETVYGLAADSWNDGAIASIFAVKGRPRFNPLILHCADLEQACVEVVFSRFGRALAKRFWPGPLTLVLRRQTHSKVSLLVSAGLDTLAVRVSSHPVARKLPCLLGRPFAAPSANLSGYLSPTSAADSLEELQGRLDGYQVAALDGGLCCFGLESTVLDLTSRQPRILRHGAVSSEELESFLGFKPLLQDQENGSAERVHSPGILGRHYAPGLPLRLEATTVTDKEALLAFGPTVPTGARKTINLSPQGDLREAAARFFQALRQLDDPVCYQRIAVMRIPQRGLGVAINERLTRATRSASRI